MHSMQILQLHDDVLKFLPVSGPWALAELWAAWETQRCWDDLPPPSFSPACYPGQWTPQFSPPPHCSAPVEGRGQSTDEWYECARWNWRARLHFVVPHGLANQWSGIEPLPNCLNYQYCYYTCMTLVLVPIIWGTLLFFVHVIWCV